MAKGHGGRRKGSGRKPGSKNKRNSLAAPCVVVVQRSRPYILQRRVQQLRRHTEAQPLQVTTKPEGPPPVEKKGPAREPHGNIVGGNERDGEVDEIDARDAFDDKDAAKDGAPGGTVANPDPSGFKVEESAPGEAVPNRDPPGFRVEERSPGEAVPDPDPSGSQVEKRSPGEEVPDPDPSGSRVGIASSAGISRPRRCIRCYYRPICTSDAVECGGYSQGEVPPDRRIGPAR